MPSRSPQPPSSGPDRVVGRSLRIFPTAWLLALAVLFVAVFLWSVDHRTLPPGPVSENGPAFWTVAILAYFAVTWGLFFGELALLDRADLAMTAQGTDRGVVISMPIRTGSYEVPWSDVSDLQPPRGRLDGRIDFHLRDGSATRRQVWLTPEQWAALAAHPRCPDRFARPTTPGRALGPAA